MQVTDDHVTLVVKDAKRDDTGPYKVVLRNPSGTVDATVNITVLGKIFLRRRVSFDSLFLYDSLMGSTVRLVVVETNNF